MSAAYEWSLIDTLLPRNKLWCRRNKAETHFQAKDIAGNANIAPTSVWSFRCTNEALEIKGAPAFIYIQANGRTEVFSIPPDQWIRLYPETKLQIGSKLYQLKRFRCKNSTPVPQKFFEPIWAPGSALGKRTTENRPPLQAKSPKKPKTATTPKPQPADNNRYFNAGAKSQPRPKTQPRAQPFIPVPNNNEVINLVPSPVWNNNEDIMIQESDQESDSEESYDNDAESLIQTPAHENTEPVARTGEDLVKEISFIFSEISVDFIRQLCTEVGDKGPGTLGLICNRILETPNPPLKELEKKEIESVPKNAIPYSFVYRLELRTYLSTQFVTVPMKAIDSAMSSTGPYPRLIPTFELLVQWRKEEYKTAYAKLSRTHTEADEKNPVWWPYPENRFRILKARRYVGIFQPKDPLLQEDIKELKRLWNIEASNKDFEIAKTITEQEYKAAGALIDCPCCYEEFPFEMMTQCLDAHLFCLNCAAKSAKVQLEEGKASQLTCFASGCTFPFPQDQIKRFLDEKTYQFYNRQAQMNEIRAIGSSIEGLEECPFCDFAMILEDAPTTVFQCKNENCGIESCRKCKKKSHIPLTCEEASEEKKLSLQSKVAEQMSEALVRECPKCKKRFLKETGCNSMVCPCGQIMCYVCRKPITGYDHFKTSGCPLHTDTAKDDAIAVEKARKAGLAAIEKEAPKEIVEEIKQAITPVTIPKSSADVAKIQEQRAMLMARHRQLQIQKAVARLTKKQRQR